MSRSYRLPLAVATISLVTLAGCGTHPTGTATPFGTTIAGNAAQVFATSKGQVELIVKRRLTQGLARPVQNARKVRSTRIPNVEVQVVTDGNIDAAIAAFKADPAVEYVEPNYRVAIPETKQSLRSAARAQQVNFPGEYGPKLTHAVDVWSKTDGTGQVIAIVDTGVDLTHPDLAPKLVAGTNTADTKATAADDQGHGTNCAGIAASLEDKQGGIVGMAPGAKIMPVKVLGADGSGSDASVAEGITWAADHGATVISLSLGGPGATQTGANAVKYALSKGAVVVAAMGNNGSGQKSYPAAYPGVIAVAATDINDQVASFSQFGSWCSVAAPGYSILSTFPTYHVAEMDDYAQEKDFWESHGMRATEKYGYLTGTSQATPHVSGLAALVKGANPGLTPAQVKAKIEGATAKPVGMSGAFDVHYGNGRIDALKSL